MSKKLLYLMITIGVGSVLIIIVVFVLTRGSSRTNPIDDPETLVVAVPETRLTTHKFIPVGETRSFGSIGAILDIVNVSAENVFSVDKNATTITCAQGGTGYIRSQYRESDFQNSVQTTAVVCVDRVGRCEGQAQLEFDFQMFMDGDRPGNANWLEQGEQKLYGVCTDSAGKVILQQPTRDLPELYYTIPDALGDGAYSVGDDEFALQRNATVTTYGGEELAPSWIATLGLEIQEGELTLSSEGIVGIPTSDCDLVPECSSSADLLVPGDIVTISFGLSEDLVLDEPFDQGALEALLDHHQITDISWAQVETMNDDNIKRVFTRLVSLQILDRLLTRYDATHDLRGKNIIIAYQAPWHNYPLDSNCLVDWASGALCSRVESLLQEEEARRVAAWIADGYTLWHSSDMSNRETWAEDLRPHPSLFPGVVLRLSGEEVPDGFTKAAVTGRLYGRASAIAQEVKSLANSPTVIAVLHAAPLELFTTSQFCEAAYCASDFKYTFAYVEQQFLGLHDVLGEQLTGFGVGIFDGSHFDIRQPIEDDGYMLNRVGETGYNNPFFNVYLAQ